MKRTKLGYTANHTILKNELKYIDKWLEYSKDIDFKVLLDTGSTDGSWEYLQELAQKDSSLIVEQKIYDPWRFDVARNYNLSMIPNNVSWVFSADMDEYFSINTLDQLEFLISQRPDVTNMSCCRLDVYSYEVFVGQPKHIGSNKIFRYGDYKWRSRIYEHVSWIHKDKPEVEIYNPNVFLIHDQDYKKQSRPELYIKMLTEVWESGPVEDDYDWCMWFLVNHYFTEKNFEMFIRTAVDYVPYAQDTKKRNEVVATLNNFLKVNPPEMTDELKSLILQRIKRN